MTAKTLNRETWLEAATERLWPLFTRHELKPVPIRVSVGWPGGRGNKNNTIGQCWPKQTASDEVAQIFISPVLDDSVRVLDVLAHEMIHAICGPGVGHRGIFVRIASMIGLEGKPTATVAGEKLKAELEAIVDELGEYPHAALSLLPAAGKSRSGAYVKVTCTSCEFTARVSKTQLATFGSPLCPVHEHPLEIPY